jgi:hypothetical protein
VTANNKKQIGRRLRELEEKIADAEPDDVPPDAVKEVFTIAYMLLDQVPEERRPKKGKVKV